MISYFNLMFGRWYSEDVQITSKEWIYFQGTYTGQSLKYRSDFLWLPLNRGHLWFADNRTVFQCGTRGTTNAV